MYHRDDRFTTISLCINKIHLRLAKAAAMRGGEERELDIDGYR